MKKVINNVVYDLTPEEIADFQKQSAIAEAQEKTRPLTEAEVSRMFIEQNINTIITDAVGSYVSDVKACDFPNEKEQY